MKTIAVGAIMANELLLGLGQVEIFNSICLIAKLVSPNEVGHIFHS